MKPLSSADTINNRINTLAEMERQFDNRNERYFIQLLNHPDIVIRTRAVCIIAEISNESAVEEISRVLKSDVEPLVRHEAAFSLGQLGFTTATEALTDALESDPSFFVRHEAAIALGVIGSERARDVLNRALSDSNEEVRKSASIAIANLDYAAVALKNIDKNDRFIRLTGG